MNWYLAKLVFSISADDNKRVTQFDEQLRLIEADSTEKALLKARALGLGEEDSFFNDKMKTIKWEFINIAELLPIKKIEDGMELYSRIHEADDARPYINYIHQKAMSLRLNAMPLF